MSVERVLAEAASIGLRAIELGPPGFLPAEPLETRRRLDAHGLALVAGFLAVTLHRPARADAGNAAITETVRLLAAAGAEVLILAATLDRGGYEAVRADLTPEEWQTLARALARARETGERHGLTVTVHPHYGTAIATARDLDRLPESSDIDVCLDTGHLLVSGADPVAVVKGLGRRIRHVHLKDADAILAERVRRGESSYHEAVARGLYRPLGEGGANIREVVELLESGGYDGWYVLEQDTVLECEPRPGAGPVAAAERSMRFLAEL